MDDYEKTRDDKRVLDAYAKTMSIPDAVTFEHLDSLGALSDSDPAVKRVRELLYEVEKSETKEKLLQKRLDHRQSDLDRCSPEKVKALYGQLDAEIVRQDKHYASDARSLQRALADAGKHEPKLDDALQAYEDAREARDALDKQMDTGKGSNSILGRFTR